MSHLKERDQKNCLNCNAQVYGKYCHICGQENIEPKETVWHLISHFFQDITHFDGKFFSSLKLLILKPGFLPKEYMVGRRASYLNPIRFYVFTSAIFFLIFFSLFKFEPNKDIHVSGDVETQGVKVSIDSIMNMDSASYRAFVDKLVASDSTLKFAYDKDAYKGYLDGLAFGKGHMRIAGYDYTTRKQYDSAVASGTHFGLIAKAIIFKEIEIHEKYNGDSKALLAALIENLLHSIPQILFITLPLFALLLKILYSRQKKYYYVNHAIYTIHLFVFIFISLLAIFAINKIADLTGADWLGYLSGILTILIFFYNYKAMRNFYQQGRGKTILKYFLLLFANIFIASFLFIIFTLLSLYKI